jgi:hypothetical protein
MTNDPINLTSAGLSGAGVAMGGGLGNNRVDAVMISTVLASQEAAIRQLLGSLGFGRNVNVVT